MADQIMNISLCVLCAKDLHHGIEAGRINVGSVVSIVEEGECKICIDFNLLSDDDKAKIELLAMLDNTISIIENIVSTYPEEIEHGHDRRN